MKKNKDKKNNRKSNSILILSLVFVMTCMAVSVFTSSELSKINYEVEKTKDKIEEQQKKNESLSMAIDELASLTKIEEVAKEKGLNYNNNNIKIVDSIDKNNKEN